jgi:methylated-DNA-[protein]-cysteine S-methyltransferase
MDYEFLDTPIGPLLLAADEAGLRHVDFPPGGEPRAGAGQTLHARRIGPDWRRSRRRLGAAIAQLQAYFAGELQAFDLELAAEGTPFRRRVWSELARIPYGCTISYGELARRIGSAQASRAVGAANGANPLPIVVPCHRVIGADGTLTGFGGGLPVKRWLLEHERRYAPRPVLSLSA